MSEDNLDTKTLPDPIPDASVFSEDISIKGNKTPQTPRDIQYADVVSPNEADDAKLVADHLGKKPSDVQFLAATQYMEQYAEAIRNGTVDKFLEDLAKQQAN